MNSSCNDAEPARRRGAATRAQVPALLKGLIYGPSGRSMSPSHTRRRDRIYRYYVSREVSRTATAVARCRAYLGDGHARELRRDHRERGHGPARRLRHGLGPAVGSRTGTDKSSYW